MSRSKRIQERENIIKKRAKKHYHWLKGDNESWALFYNNIKAGVKNQFLKHTGVACSCWDCSKSVKYSKKDRVKNKKI